MKYSTFESAVRKSAQGRVVVVVMQCNAWTWIRMVSSPRHGGDYKSTWIAAIAHESVRSRDRAYLDRSSNYERAECVFNRSRIVRVYPLTGGYV